ncbi:MAG: carboxymuconolactone decarboxylase family protein [Bacteroidota bacterium]|nr:carboxymuconolactone decarboxylase family protein [Bacteroidota bacterium]
MTKRISIKKVDPAAYKAMYALENYVEASKVTPIHQELIRIRASQVNGCAYCIDMHTKDARKNGETEQRIYTLSAWRETPFFTEEERAILALTEEVTLINQQVSDETYEKAAKLLGEEYLAQVIMIIITINAWNRIGITTKMQPALD